MNLAGDTNIQSIATTIVGLEKEKDVWEVTGLYVEEEEEDANLRLSTVWLAPWILQIQDCSLFSEQFLYIEMITNAEYEKPTKIKCGHIMLYYIIYLIIK